MTDTAIPIPENLHAVRTLQRSMGRSAQRRRVRNLMPKLAMQEVLVHGYTPHKEGVTGAAV